MGRGGGLEEGSLAGEFFFGGGELFFFSLGFVFVLFVLCLFCCWIGFGVFLVLIFRASSFVCFLSLFVLVCFVCLFVLECFCCFFLCFLVVSFWFVFVLFFVVVEVV